MFETMWKGVKKMHCGDSGWEQFYQKWWNSDCFLAGLDGSLLVSGAGQLRGCLPKYLPLWIRAFTPLSTSSCLLLICIALFSDLLHPLSSIHLSSTQPTIYPFHPLQHLCLCSSLLLSFLPPFSPFLPLTILSSLRRRSARNEWDHCDSMRGQTVIQVEKWKHPHAHICRKSTRNPEAETPTTIPFENFIICRLSPNILNFLSATLKIHSWQSAWYFLLHPLLIFSPIYNSSRIKLFK